MFAWFTPAECHWLCIYLFAVRSRPSRAADSSLFAEWLIGRPSPAPTYAFPVGWAANTVVPSMYMAAPQFAPMTSLPRPIVFPPHTLSSMSSPQSPMTGSSHGELAESLNRMAIGTQMDPGMPKGAEKRDSVQRSESGRMASPGVIGQGSNIDQRLA